MTELDEISDVGSERAILGGIVKYGVDSYLDICDIIRASSFTGECNKVIYQCIKHIYDNDPKTVIDIPLIQTASTQLGYSNFFDKIDNFKYLRAITNVSISQTNIRKLASIISKLEIGRLLNEQLKLSSNELLKINGTESIGSILGIVENPIFDLTSLLNSDDNNEIKSLGIGAVEYVEHLKNNPRQTIGISSGYPLWDQALGGGFRKGCISVCAARVKNGKSFHAMNIALFVSTVLEYPVLVLDSEMVVEDQLVRALANRSTTPINDIEKGMFQTREREVLEAAKSLANKSYDFHNISGTPFEDVIAIMRRWINKKVGFDENGNTKPCLIIYDYLKLTSSDGISGSMQEYQMLGFQMTALHNFMVRYKVPCLAYIQLNRDGITKETSDAISGSDRIAWLCSNLSIFKAKSEEEIMEDGLSNGNRKIVVVLARHGEGLQDGDYINMQADLKYGQIKELNTRSQIHGKNQGGKILGSDNNDDSTDFDSPVPF